MKLNLWGIVAALLICTWSSNAFAQPDPVRGGGNEPPVIQDEAPEVKKPDEDTRRKPIKSDGATPAQASTKKTYSDKDWYLGADASLRLPLPVGRDNLFHHMLEIPAMEGAYIVPKETWWIGADWTLSKSSQDDGADGSHEALFGELDVLARYSVHRALELRYGFGIAGLDSDVDEVVPVEDGASVLVDEDVATTVSDFTLGVKWIGWKNEEAAAALAVDVKFPIDGVDNFTSNGGVDISVGGIYSRRIAEAEFHVNLGIQIVDDVDDELLNDSIEADPVIYYGVAVSNPIMDGVHLVGQIQGNSSAFGDLEGVNEAPLSLHVGGRFHCSDRFTSHLSLGFGLGDGSSDFILGLGTGYRF